MKLTHKLLRALNRVWDKRPGQVLVLTISHAGGVGYAVADGFLTVTPTAAPLNALTIDLSQYTLLSLADFLITAGYQATLNGSLRLLGALVLLDCAGTNLQGGGQLFAYTSVVWSFLEAFAAQINAAAAQIVLMPAEMSTTTADTIWLDALGRQFGIPRNFGEQDSPYGVRIIATVLAPKGNNVAMEAALRTATGQSTVTVTDATTYGPVEPRYDGVHTHNGTIYYNTAAVPVYNQFDVNLGYDLLGAFDPTDFATAATAIINQLRDAGMHLRGISLAPATITDTMNRPGDSSTLTTTLQPLHDGTFTYDGVVAYGTVVTVGALEV